MSSKPRKGLLVTLTLGLAVVDEDGNAFPVRDGDRVEISEFFADDSRPLFFALCELIYGRMRRTFAKAGLSSS